MLYKLLFLILVTRSLVAFDFKPWFGICDEAQVRADALSQSYNSVDIPDRPSWNHKGRDFFYTLSVAYPFMRYSGEFEAVGANTKCQHWTLDCVRILGRYMYCDQELGAPFNFAIGLDVGQALMAALRDVSSFHHGRIEGQMTFAVGKRYGPRGCYDEFHFRWWTVSGVGIGERGTQWIRVDGACEYKWGFSQFRLLFNTLWGCGGNDIEPCHFNGYGPIRHRSVDLGFRYTLAVRCGAQFGLQYARRVFAYNFPENADLVLVELFYPIGHQSVYRY